LHTMRVGARGNWKLAGEPEGQREEVLNELFDQGMGLRVVVDDIE